jgi:hypothetical protein
MHDLPLDFLSHLANETKYHNFRPHLIQKRDYKEERRTLKRRNNWEGVRKMAKEESRSTTDWEEIKNYTKGQVVRYTIEDQGWTLIEFN